MVISIMFSFTMPVITKLKVVAQILYGLTVLLSMAIIYMMMFVLETMPVLLSSVVVMVKLCVESELSAMNSATFSVWQTYMLPIIAQITTLQVLGILWTKVLIIMLVVLHLLTLLSNVFTSVGSFLLSLLMETISSNLLSLQIPL